MGLRDPIAVYNAADNMEAVFVRDALVAAGIEAYVTEDVSQVGAWVGGFIPELHKPQVWVERADSERARPVLDNYEERAAHLRGDRASAALAEPPVEVVCDRCGGHASFPATQEGSVQQCPHCGAYLDVGDTETTDGWGDAEGEPAKPEDGGDEPAGA
jgi:hypothetical protein